MRDRLLARAKLADQPFASGVTAAEMDPLSLRAEASAVRGVEDALDQVAAGGRRPPTPVRLAGAELSANALAIFGALIGLATVVSLFAALIHFAPRQREQAASVSAAGSGNTPAAAVATQTAVKPPLPGAAPERKGPWRIEHDQAAPSAKVLTGSIGKAAFLTAIQDAGLSKTQAYRVYNALKSERNLDRCRPSDSFIALVDRASSRVTAFEYIAGKEEIFQAKESTDGKLYAKALDLQVQRRRVEGVIQVSDNFAASAITAGFQASIGRVLNRALEGHTSVDQLERGDVLRVVGIEVTVLGDFARYDGVEALELRRHGSEDITRIYYFPVGGKARYVDAKGRAPGMGEWVRPLRSAPITSRFNPKRMHPILKRVQPHNGTDFGAPTGTPIRAAAGGTVRFIGDSGPNGNFIAISHGDTYESGYSHLSRFEPQLKLGDRVEKKQVIGYVGTTGRSTGPHLHFSVKKRGVFIDPESLNLGGLSVLPRGERELLQEVRAKYDPLLDALPVPSALPGAPAPAVRAKPPGNAIADDATEDVAALPAAAPALPAAAVSPTVDPDDEEPDSDDPSAPITPATAPAVAPRNTAVNAGSIYMSDADLLRMQNSADDGEVEE